MTIRFALVSDNQLLVRLVTEFAHGLGWAVEDAPASAGVTLMQPDVVDSGEHVLRLLTYVGLAASKAGIDASEPLCRVRYREAKTTEVTLALRIVELNLHA